MTGEEKDEYFMLGIQRVPKVVVEQWEADEFLKDSAHAKLVGAINWYLSEQGALSAPTADKISLIDEWFDDTMEHLRYEYKNGLNSMLVNG